MGWLYRYEPVRNVKEHIDTDVFRCSLPGHAYNVLDSAVVGNTYYAAVQRITPDHAPYVFAAVILFRNPKSGFGYKDMDESMGPCEVACPLRILNRLSPFADMPGGLAHHANAAEWRERVRAYHHAKSAQAKKAKLFKPGDWIKLAQPLTFRGGFEEDTFIVRRYPRRGKTRTAYEAATRGCLCAIPRRLLTDAAVVAA